MTRTPLAAAIPVPQGEYRLRVAAIDARGRAATSDYSLQAFTRPAEPARLGGLMIGVGTRGFERPVLQVSSEAEVFARFELYGRPEIPFKGEVLLVDGTEPNSKILFTTTPEVAATAIPDKFSFTARIQTGPLAPGDYIVRARVGFEGNPTGELTYVLRKVSQ